MNHPRRSLVMRLVFGLTAAAFFVAVFMFCEDSFLQQRLASLPRTRISISSTSSASTVVTAALRQDESSSSSSSFLNVRPIGLTQCTTVRFRSEDDDPEEESASVSYTVEQAMDIIITRQQQQHQQTNKLSPTLRVGLVFVENPTDFVSLSKGVFHLFHFLEFLVVAYTELHRLQQAAAMVVVSDMMMNKTLNATTSAGASTLHAVQVPWLYLPLMTRQEICGAAHGMNCLILNMILTASIPSTSSTRQQQGVAIFGVESNDNITRHVHEAFAGVWPKRKQQQQQQQRLDEDALFQEASFLHKSSSTSSSFSQQQQHFADLVLLIDRHACKRQQKQRIQKMWTNYIADNNNVDVNMNNSDGSNNVGSANDNNDNVSWQTRPSPSSSRRFPAELWHADVMTALGDTLYPPPSGIGAVVATTTHAHAASNDDAENENSSVSSFTSNKPAVVPATTICYIDRQGTNRRLPDAFHDWLVGYLESHEQLDFVHLHMENYAALDQIRLAASCRVLLGAHGNGLSHVAWMQPSASTLSGVGSVDNVGAVVEVFFDYPFYYDYATLSQLFRLRYFALWNGHVLDAQRIAQRNVTILQETRSVLLENQTKYSSFAQESQANPDAVAQRLQVAQAALQIFLESILHH
jgi:Glycosyltransferase 61